MWLLLLIALVGVGYGESADDRIILRVKYENRNSRPSYGGGNVYLTGEINKPLNAKWEKLKLDSKDNLKDLILLGGGVTEFSNNKYLVIYRDGVKYAIRFDLGDFDRIKLDQGDIVFIPPKIFMGR